MFLAHRVIAVRLMMSVRLKDEGCAMLKWLIISVGVWMIFELLILISDKMKWGFL